MTKPISRTNFRLPSLQPDELTAMEQLNDAGRTVRYRMEKLLPYRNRLFRLGAMTTAKAVYPVHESLSMWTRAWLSRAGRTGDEPISLYVDGIMTDAKPPTRYEDLLVGSLDAEGNFVNPDMLQTSPSQRIYVLDKMLPTLELIAEQQQQERIRATTGRVPNHG